MFFCPNCNNSFDLTKLSSKSTDTKSQEQTQTETETSQTAQAAGAKPKSVRGGEKINYDELVSKILNDTDISDMSMGNFVLDNLLINSSYTKLTKEQKELIYNTIQDLLPLTHKDKRYNESTKQYATSKIHFICNNCGFMKKVEPKTKIFSRESDSMTKTFKTSDYSDILNSDIVPITRKYTCINPKCESHKNNEVREAIILRLNNSFEVKYICKACKTVF